MRQVETINDAADMIVNQLKQMGFIIQRYDSYSTQSVYLKLDYGVCNSIRISDHKGKKHLKYRYNLITTHSNSAVTVDTFERRYYCMADIQHMIADISNAKEEKISKYGESLYRQYMKRNKEEKGNKTGFWRQAVEV